MFGLCFIGVFCCFIGFVIGFIIGVLKCQIEADIPREKRGVPKMENPPPMPQNSQKIEKTEDKVPNWEPGSFIDMHGQLNEKRRRIFEVAHGSEEYETLKMEIINLAAKMKETGSLPKYRY